MKPIWCGLAIFTLALCLARSGHAQYAYTTFGVPGATATYAWGINDAGHIVGLYADPGAHGFLLSNGNYTQFDVPGASQTSGWGINNSGQIVGRYDANNQAHGFLLSEGEYTSIDVPGADATAAYGINDAGDIVGEAVGLPGGHGFSLKHGKYTLVDVPGALRTSATGIDSIGQIVGWYTSTRSRGLRAPCPACPEEAGGFLNTVSMRATGGLRR